MKKGIDRIVMPLEVVTVTKIAGTRLQSRAGSGDYLRPFYFVDVIKDTGSKRRDSAPERYEKKPWFHVCYCAGDANPMRQIAVCSLIAPGAIRHDSLPTVHAARACETRLALTADGKPPAGANAVYRVVLSPPAAHDRISISSKPECCIRFSKNQLFTHKSSKILFFQLPGYRLLPSKLRFHRLFQLSRETDDTKTCYPQANHCTKRDTECLKQTSIHKRQHAKLSLTERLGVQARQARDSLRPRE